MKVEMQKSENPRYSFTQEIDQLITFGAAIRVGPKSHAAMNKAGYSLKIHTESVTVNVGIGNDHIAELVMTREAYEALLKGEKPTITTSKQFRDKYVRKRKSC